MATATPPLLSGDTLPAWFWNAVTERGGQVWLRQKELGYWRSWDWNETGQAVREIGNGLLALGLGARENVSILSNANVEWVLADLAILSCAGVCGGIYPSDGESQVQAQCADASTCMLFVENDEQLDKVLGLRARLPALRKTIVFDMKGLRDLDDPDVLSLDALRALGRDWASRHPEALDKRWRAGEAGQAAVLIHTCGTTGRPQAMLHSHAGVLQAVRRQQGMLPQDAHDERICFLPLCHVDERVGAIYQSLYTGTVLNFVENQGTVSENVREVSPTVFRAVPRVWEKLHSEVMLSIRESSPLQRAVSGWAIAVGQRAAEARLSGRPTPLGLRLQFLLARWLALDNARRLIGIHRARFLVSSSAPLATELVRWYLALGIPMLEVWGMAETCGAVTGGLDARLQPGSVGRPAPGIHIRVDADSGEILIRGDTLFVADPDLPGAARPLLDADGWLHTGDRGEIDAHGHLRIIDRLQDTLALDNGRQVAPSALEYALKASPYITDALVTGAQRPWLTVLVLLHQESVEKFVQEQDLAFGSFAGLTRAPQVRALVQAEIERVNATLPEHTRIRSFHLFDTQIGAGDEELTPAMKLRRHLVQNKYAAQIDALYAP